MMESVCANAGCSNLAINKYCSRACAPFSDLEGDTPMTQVHKDRINKAQINQKRAKRLINRAENRLTTQREEQYMRKKAQQRCVVLESLCLDLIKEVEAKLGKSTFVTMKARKVMDGEKR